MYNEKKCIYLDTRKSIFWYIRVSAHEIMIPGHYIIGNESYNTPLNFPKDLEWNFKFETKIYNNFIFWRKNWAFFTIFSTKNWNCCKFWSQTWNFILNLSESVERCYDFYFLWYSDRESWSRGQIFVFIRKCFFFYPNICIFPVYIFYKGLCVA